jgi:long-chain acyl-CoA synthetase
MEKKYFEATEFKNLKEVMEASVRKYGNKTAFIVKLENKEKKNISYKELYDDINSFGSALYNLGYKDKRVAIIGKNRYEWVVAHLANQFGGMISVPLDKDLQFEELESSLIRSKADVIVFDPKLTDLVMQVKDAGKTNLKEYILMDKSQEFTNVPDLIAKGKQLIENGYDEFLNYEIDENRMNTLLFTSGTTSKSKAVMLNQRGVASNIYALQLVEDVHSYDTNIAFLPFHHIFGSTCIIFMLSQGVTTCFPDGLRYIKQNLKEYGVSVFVGVPILTEAIYKAIRKEIEKQNKTKLVDTLTKICNFLLKFKIDIRRVVFKSILKELGGKLRLIVVGGAAQDPEVIKGFDSFGITTVQGYGLTETSPVVAAESYVFRKTGTVGRPMPNVEVKIFNPDDDGVGEVIVRGPNIMLGYYEMEEKTNEVLVDGWFHTGDIGYLDEDGCLVLTGRNKSMIVLKNGKKVFPEELETIVNRLDLVLESMVYGLENEDDKVDVTLSIKVVYDDEYIKEKYSDKTDEELDKILWEQIKEINKGFPRYKHIQNMTTTHTELIKTTTKKIKRFEEMKLIKEGK